MYNTGTQYGQQIPGQAYQPYSRWPSAYQQAQQGKGKGSFDTGGKGGGGKGHQAPPGPQGYGSYGPPGSAGGVGYLPQPAPTPMSNMESWTPMCDRPVDETKLKNALGTWSNGPALDAFKHFKLCAHLLTSKGVDSADCKFAGGKVPCGALMFISKRDQTSGPGQFARDIMQLSGRMTQQWGSFDPAWCLAFFIQEKGTMLTNEQLTMMNIAIPTDMPEGKPTTAGWGASDPDQQAGAGGAALGAPTAKGVVHEPPEEQGSPGIERLRKAVQVAEEKADLRMRLAQAKKSVAASECPYSPLSESEDKDGDEENEVPSIRRDIDLSLLSSSTSTSKVLSRYKQH